MADGAAESRPWAALLLTLVLLMPLAAVSSAGTGKSVTGNETISIEMAGLATLPNVRFFETAELITWNLTWSGIDNSTNNLYEYDYTIHAGYVNNGTLMFSGNGTGFSTENGTLPFSMPAFEIWNGTYEYTLRFVLWDQGRNQLLDFAEVKFVILQTVITPSHSKFLVFGDSLSDMGNSYAAFGTPESPPYYSGRFTDGPMWNEYVANELGLTITPGSGGGGGTNRAYGGAEAGPGNNFFVIPNIGKQIDDYTSGNWIGPAEKVAVWGGGNNFLNSGETDTQKVVDYMVDHVNTLVSNGANDLIVLNLPPLEQTPTYADESDANKQAMRARVIDYNTKLESAMVARESALNVSISFIDVHKMSETIYWNSSFYGISNVTHAACHHSGYTCDSNDYIEPTVDGFVYFDKIHPTGTSHRLLGLYIIEQIGTPDTDGDGIEDDNDNCQRTPIGDEVNHFGCRLVDLDSDADGINDLLDQCPSTNSGSTVDEDGCADYQKDTDGDGISDNLDLCPESSPFGIEVDENGCADYQKDTDNDGVTDDVDICPNSDVGIVVNEIGCAQNQIDDDWDLVMNDRDQCPSTPLDEEVNADGCSLSQLDTDDDGVTDDIDLCPNTPETTLVDSDGCALSQLDTDIDGVSDAEDECPFTPLTEQSDERGCSATQRDTDDDGRSDAIDECPFTRGSIRGCPVLELQVEIERYPAAHDDFADIRIQFTCEYNCTMTIFAIDQWHENLTGGEMAVAVPPHVGTQSFEVRLEASNVWAQKNFDIIWPAAPINETPAEDNPDVSDEADEVPSTSDKSTSGWEASNGVEMLLAGLISLLIIFVIASIAKQRGDGGKPKQDWRDPSALSTFEVERELRTMPENTPAETVTVNEEQNSETELSGYDEIPAIGELFD